jgi:hypothetical protein
VEYSHQHTGKGTNGVRKLANLNIDVYWNMIKTTSAEVTSKQADYRLGIDIRTPILTPDLALPEEDLTEYSNDVR